MLKKQSDGAVTRERTFIAGVKAQKGSAVKVMISLLFVIGVFAAAKLMGAAERLWPEERS